MDDQEYEDKEEEDTLVSSMVVIPLPFLVIHRQHWDSRR